MKKFIVFIVVSLLCVIECSAQTLNGHTYDSKLEPIEGVAVSLSKQGDTIAVHRTQTDNAGDYSFSGVDEKNLNLKFSHPAFHPAETVLILNADTTIVTVLTPKEVNIGEVIVTARKQAFEIRNGKVVANIASLPGYQTENAFGILNRLPGVLADNDGGIRLHGQPVQVLMDGRELTGMDAAVLLKALPSSALSQIELISDKRAQHDASTSAVINIIPVKRMSGGWNMNLNANASIDMEKHFDPGASIYFMLRKKRVLFSNVLTFESYTSSEVATVTTLYGTDNLLVTEHSRNLSHAPGRFIDNVDIMIDLNRNSSLNLNLFVFSGGERRTSDTSQETDGETIRYLTKSSPGNNVLSGSVGYKSKYFDLRYGVVFNRADRDFDYHIDDPQDAESHTFVLRKKINNLYHTLKVDYSRAFVGERLVFSAGLKGGFNKLDNTDVYTPEIYAPIHFAADEAVLAAYAEINYEFSPKLSVNGGVRAEESIYSIRYGDDTRNNSYLNVVPSVGVSYTPSKKYSNSLSFNSAISRPSFEDLTPGIVYETDRDYYRGNPSLLPTKMYSIAFSNYFLGKISLRISARYFKDLMQDIMVEQPGGVTESVYENAVDFRGLSFYCNVPLTFFDSKLFLKISGSHSFGEHFNPKNGFVLLPEDIKFRQSYASLYLDYSIVKRLGVNISGYYSSRTHDLQIETGHKYYFDFGFRLSLLKNGSLNFSAVLKDAFNTNDFHSIKRYGNSVRTTDLTSNSRMVIMSLSYSLNRGAKIDKQHHWDPNEKERYM